MDHIKGKERGDIYLRGWNRQVTYKLINFVLGLLGFRHKPIHVTTAVKPMPKLKDQSFSIPISGRQSFGIRCQKESTFWGPVSLMLGLGLAQAVGPTGPTIKFSWQYGNEAPQHVSEEGWCVLRLRLLLLLLHSSPPHLRFYLIVIGHLAR